MFHKLHYIIVEPKVKPRSTHKMRNNVIKIHFNYYRGKWSDLGITANVNDYVDETISMLVPLIQQFGLDPMDLPDVEEGFEVVRSEEV